MSMFSLKGRVALVTGSSRGLGLAMAEGLAEAGAHVILNGRDGDTLTKAADGLKAKGLSASIAPFDVTDKAARDAGMAKAIAEKDRLDILVGNAGIQHRSAIDDWDEANWNRVVDANLSSCFFLARAAAVQMKKQRSGRMIFTTSITGLMGRATIHAYVASKSGLAGVTRSLASELGEFGITANSLAPGYFKTEINTALLADEAFVARINARIALRRWAEPRELAGAAVFLASDAGGYVTGQQLCVDGGFTTTF